MAATRTAWPPLQWSRRAKASPLCDVLDDLIKAVEDVLLGDAHDVPSEIAERTISSRVRPRAVFVVGTIHLHNEADLGRSEVHDPMPDDELPTEWKARL